MKKIEIISNQDTVYLSRGKNDELYKELALLWLTDTQNQFRGLTDVIAVNHVLLISFVIECVKRFGENDEKD